MYEAERVVYSLVIIREQWSQFDDSSIVSSPSIDCDRSNGSRDRNRVIAEESD